MSRPHWSLSVAAIGGVVVAAAGTLVFAFRRTGNRVARLENTLDAVQGELRRTVASVRALQESTENSNRIDAAMAIDLLRAAPEEEVE